MVRLPHTTRDDRHAPSARSWPKLIQRFRKKGLIPWQSRNERSPGGRDELGRGHGGRKGPRAAGRPVGDCPRRTAPSTCSASSRSSRPSWLSSTCSSPAPIPAGPLIITSATFASWIAQATIESATRHAERPAEPPSAPSQRHFTISPSTGCLIAPLRSAADRPGHRRDLSPRPSGAEPGDAAGSAAAAGNSTAGADGVPPRRRRAASTASCPTRRRILVGAGRHSQRQDAAQPCAVADHLGRRGNPTPRLRRQADRERYGGPRQFLRSLLPPGAEADLKADRPPIGDDEIAEIVRLSIRTAVANEARHRVKTSSETLELAGPRHVRRRASGRRARQGADRRPEVISRRGKSRR